MVGREAQGERADRSFLSRLARDTGGNTLAIVGASLLPLLAMMGSGIDLTRTYMAHARLQQACDAAALAGRRVMSGGVVNQTVTDEARKFFNFNFPQATWGTAAFTPSITQGPDSTVVVAASTTIPTQIMRLFGFTTLPLDVTCDAKQDFVNTDIVLVLDTTGSMDQDVNGTDVNGGPSSKIVALRAAVLALYDELTPVQTKLEAAGLRLRYSIVPFSSGMNVGAILKSVNPNYIVSDNYTYQSRIAKYAHSETGTTASYCSGKGGSRSNSGTCTYTDNNPSGGTFASWTYQPMTYPVTDYVNTLSASGATLGTVNTPAQNTTVTPYGIYAKLTYPAPIAATSSWKGCIEERQTVSTITGSSGYTIPSDAWDLDIDMIPNGNNATKWAPYWPEVEFRADGVDQDAYQRYYWENYRSFPGYNSKPQVACPAPATRLQVWSRATLSTYLDTLTPDGGTYHDNGMIWGARLLSRGGIFAADNPATYGSMPVSRQVIYMTDGIIDTGATLYHTYGMEKWDKRVTGGYTTDADSDARHDQRFKMMCAATKQMGVSIWVIAFASTLSDSLKSCATSEAQASVSANSAQLTAKFVEIGKSIGALRLTQ
ncbi:TadE/TadG family type IV pilus assembly protein [Sphingomonas profundi]|uniref:TadE/TadG family type IV pilus assembly protein n=1 Tax=Alterirhizorhabdus profundi TaxID=2681549 RepID=UPI0012E89F3C|nr:TadE/TadG family type IV pilus assembly protein [Sphingomonas profundi]